MTSASSQKSIVKKGFLLRIFFLGIFIVGLSLQTGGAEALHTWLQTDWSGGATTIPATHPADQIDWDRFYSKDAGITAGAELTLTRTAASITHTTDIDFGAGTLATTTVVGTGAAAKVELTATGAWDVTTATIVRNFRVADQETSPRGVFFKPDGTRMFVIGSASDVVHEYHLTTAWDVSTAGFSTRSFSVADQETAPQGVFFKSDGLRMFVTGFISDAVHEYHLTVAWDVTTATIVRNFSVADQETTPRSVFFKPDGLRMFVIGSASDRVHEYHLITTYHSPGTFISSPIDTGQNSDFTTLGFTIDKPMGTDLKFQLRSAATAADLVTAVWYGPTGTTDHYITTGTTINPIHDGHRWIQYKAFFSTIDTAVTPRLLDITINYQFYPTSASLISSPFNTGNVSNILENIVWSESLPAGTEIKFQVRTSPDNITWTPWAGPCDGGGIANRTFSTTTFFTDPAGTEAIDADLQDGLNDQWIQYRVWLETTDGTVTPTLSDVTINYRFDEVAIPIPYDKWVIVTPHPVPAEGAIFWLNLPEETVSATLKIFAVDGRLLVSIQLDSTAIAVGRWPAGDRWSLEDRQGRRLGSGLYIYLVKIVDSEGITTVSPAQKMVIDR